MEPFFIGQVMMFGGNFAPRGWAFCNGQLLAVSSNDALFSILGTIYGGDGRTTFGLPDLRGRIPLHEGTGPGLTPRPLGQKGGVETITLNLTQIPAHNHSVVATETAADNRNPKNDVLANAGIYHNTADTNSALNPSTITQTGGFGSHENMMPYNCVNFIIALQGTYPSRS